MFVTSLRSFAITIFITILFMVGCDHRQAEQLTVFAGAGLKDVLPEIAEAYRKISPDVEITFNFASAGTLQKQVEQGAAADLLVVPGKKELAALAAQNLTEPSTVKEVATDVLVLIVPRQQKEIKNFSDLAKPQFTRISIGNPETVPAGEWAKKALLGLGLWNTLESRLILAKDVRQVMAYVETGNVDAGLVWRSTALQSTRVKIAAVVPPDAAQAVSFHAVLLKK